MAQLALNKLGAEIWLVWNRSHYVLELLKINYFTDLKSNTDTNTLPVESLDFVSTAQQLASLLCQLLQRPPTFIQFLKNSKNQAPHWYCRITVFFIAFLLKETLVLGSLKLYDVKQKIYRVTCHSLCLSSPFSFCWHLQTCWLPLLHVHSFFSGVY